MSTMNFDLSEEQELYKATAEKFFSSISVAQKIEVRASENGYDLSRWKKLVELGLIMLAAKEANGGLGGNMVDLATVSEAVGLHNAIDPWLENGVLPVRILETGSNHSLLSDILSGDKICALAFSELNARYNTAFVETEAVETPAGFTINGTKEFILGGKIADYFLVTAKLDGIFDIFIVPKDALGVNLSAYKVSDGSVATKIEFAGVNIPNGSRLNVSIDMFQNIISDISLLACAEMIGLSELLLNQTIEYTKQREQFGKSISSFQVVQHALVDCYTELEQMRSLVFRTLLNETENESVRRGLISGTKSFVSDRADFIARNAVQYHGAMGITEEAGIGFALKRIMLLSRLFGDSAHCLEDYLRVA